jgi:hypothetical protein
MGSTPPDGDRRHLGQKNGVHGAIVDLRDAIGKLLAVQTERHQQDDEWRQKDDQTHSILITKVARQSVYIWIGGAITGAVLGWLALMNAKVDRVEQSVDDRVHELEQKLREDFGAVQVRNEVHHYKRASMETDIERNKETIKELERRVFGRSSRQKE